MATELLSSGVWGVLATPFSEDGSQVDHESLVRQVQMFAQVGAQGVVALGVFGEAERLSTRETVEIVQTVVESRAGLGVVAGITDRATRPAQERAASLAEASGGALAGVMLQVNSPSAIQLVPHFKAVSDAAGTGLVVQDYPLVSGVTIALTELIEAVTAADAVVAVKAEAPPTPKAVQQLSSSLDVPVFGGLGGVALLDELASGAAGAMTGFSFPEGLVAAVRAWESGGFSSARAAWAPWLPIAVFEAQPGLALGIRKRLLHMRGILGTPVVRPPGVECPSELLGLLGRHLDAAQGLIES